LSNHSQLLELVGDELMLVEAKLQAPSELFEPLAGALDLLLESGGKRLRPALALLAGKLYPATECGRLVSLAAAIEALHTATLVHDDLVDGSLLRRGQPTLNASWSTGATVLAGDYVFARAAYFAAETDSVRVMQIFAQTLMTIVEGELRQLLDLRNWLQSKDAYFRRIYGKTAALFAAATESAGVLGQAPEEEVSALRDYGYHLGMAFQIMDDILDFVGDERTIGKPVGSDLRHGTVTLPVYYYLQAHPDAIQVMQTTGNGHNATDALTELITDIGRSPAIEATRADAAMFVLNAKEALDLLPASVYRDQMSDLADYVLSRHL
jgi:geranylgeranyl pyrophosphate synthase